ncbi:MAG TPA: NAD(P)-dependent oxidoreductase [Burkholderiales bacterium]|nr:NAD(P)-dependent oxidoreductase [Burkholderiales bacterium]
MIKTVTTSTPVGFIGLGVIGAAMAGNLLKAGFKVTVHNRSRGKVEELVRKGAVDGGSPAGVARASEVVLVCVPDTPDVERVLFGDDGLVHGIRRGTVVIDCSTISATATVEFSARLRTLGVEMLDSPVSGGPKGAQDAALSCMIGGDAAVVEACMPLFRAIGKTFTHVGASGAGQTCKSCNQLVLVGTLMAISEAFALAGRMDIDPGKVREALLGGSAQSFVLANHGKRLLDGTLAPGFRAELMLKDIKLALSAGRDTGTFMPATALGAQMFAALCNTGRGGLDSAALGLLFRELSGVKS